MIDISKSYVRSYGVHFYDNCINWQLYQPAKYYMKTLQNDECLRKVSGQSDDLVRKWAGTWDEWTYDLDERTDERTMSLLCLLPTDNSQIIPISIIKESL